MGLRGLLVRERRGCERRGEREGEGRKEGRQRGKGKGACCAVVKIP